MKILFLHGLESGPGGHKPTWLRAKGHDVVAPELPTKPVSEYLKAEKPPVPLDLLLPSYAVAKQALQAKPDVVIGSSFGGGIAAMLAVYGDWDGPLVLLAPAARGVTLPKRSGRVAIIHGRGDDVVPCNGSQAMAAGSACEVMLWVVEDDHRLKASVEAGKLGEAIAWATSAK